MLAGIAARLHLRWTVRLRLTLTYTALFVVTGALLLVLLYVLLSNALAPPTPRTGIPQGSGPITNISRGNTAADQADDTLNDQLDETRREERSAALQQVQVQATIALLLMSVASFVLGWIVAGRVLRPIRQITAHAQHASEATLNERIDLRGPPDELTNLANTIDGMLDRLQSAFESQRDFAAKASHELRTPLAIIGAEADIALDAPDASERERTTALAIRNATNRSERLIDGLLMLARSESTMRDNARIDLAEVAGDIAGELVGEADIAGVAIDLQLDSAFVLGDRTLLERLVGNLVENGIRYNIRGGWLRLHVRRDGDRSVVIVENSGNERPIGNVNELFKPFQRGGGATSNRRERTSGFGLGLAIVQSVAEVRAATIVTTARQDGGLRVEVRFPAAPAPARLPTRNPQWI